MNKMLLVDFIDRVVTSRERVQFTQIDPYGHLNAARYAELLINHRITAVQDQLGVVTLDIAKNLGVAFFISRLDIQYISPVFLGEELEIASWVDKIEDSAFRLRMVISGEKNRKVRAIATEMIQTVDIKTGKPVACPKGLPTQGEVSLLSQRPNKIEYTATLKNYQES